MNHKTQDIEMKKRLLLKSIAALTACAAPLLGWAAWPDKPIRMVVPYAAGGGADNTARIVAQQMSAALGQQIVIDNRPGAGGVIGATTSPRRRPTATPCFTTPRPSR